MNPLVVFASVILVVVANCEAKPQNYNEHRVRRQLPGVPSQFQNINIENYLRNERAVKFQLKCVIYEGPCDSIGKYLKSNIPIWLRTQCRNCNDEQKTQAGKLINFFQSSYSKEWDDAVKKFAKGTFTDEEIARFESELGVKIEGGGAATPGKKPDHNALAELAKESIALLKATKEPIVLERGGSTSTVPTISSDASSKAAEPTVPAQPESESTTSP